MKKPLLILTGPTAVGKTKLSIALAKTIGGEIISADSCQVYRHMDIGSAKIKPEEMQGVAHHMIDVLEPTEPFNVSIFKERALSCIESVYSRGKIPIVAGGTGFYIQALLYDIQFTENEDNLEIREKWEKLAEEKGNIYLHECLRRIDEAAADQIHANNRKRVIRALEYYELTGQKISEHNEQEHARESAYDSRYFVLNDKREKIYARIDRRVDKMLADGLVEEVRYLLEMGCQRGSTAMQALGYKEIADYLDGLTTLEEAVYRIKRDTRHFAKRQLTWFRRERDVIWISREDFGNDEAAMLQYMIRSFENGEETIAEPVQGDGNRR